MQGLKGCATSWHLLLQFAKLGFQCLSRPMFLQFLSSGVFTPPASIVQELVAELMLNGEEDVAFRVIMAMPPSDTGDAGVHCVGVAMWLSLAFVCAGHGEGGGGRGRNPH